MGDGSEEVLDYSKRDLEKIPKATDHQSQTIVTLNLDENELRKLDCVESYVRLENLSVCRNSLMRMYGVGKLTCLRDLNLSNNAILTIEGLKELVLLKKLQLSCNNIKSIEHLNNNTNLEYLDLSDNQISHMSDISYLKNLKTLLLERNKIGNLRQCERYLPTSLTNFGIAGNFLVDLNTMCHLGQLHQLEGITIEGNPCVSSVGEDKISFDYRPFVINWVINVKMVDGIEVNAIERLKAEWLYSQGKGRQFREGEHIQVVQYLNSTCPLESTAPETEEQRKLRLILSKAQQHQQQLREQGPTPPRVSKQSPRMHARIVGRVVSKSPDRSMSSSFHSALSSKNNSLLGIQSSQMSTSFSGEIPSHNTPIKNILDNKSFDSPNIMSQSFDTSSILTPEPDRNQKENKVISTEKSKIKIELKESIVDNKSKELKGELHCDSNKALNQPLEAASKMVPVPDSLMSPDYQGPLFSVQPGVLNSNAQNIISNKNISNGNHSPQITNPRQYKSNMKTPTSIAKSAVGSNIKSNLGSPQLSRSAMSSPKLRHNEQRKGSFSSRINQQANNDEIHAVKNVYNQKVQTPNKGKVNETNVKKTLNGNNKSSPTVKIEAQKVIPPDIRDHNSSDDDSEMCIEKLQSIRDAANQRRQKQTNSDSVSIESSNVSKQLKVEPTYLAAVKIQKLWRGYRTRNLNPKTGTIMHSIQTMRARQHLEKLSCDMEATKAALDSERKIQQLQMQAINALWKKISVMENSNDKVDEKNDKGQGTSEKSKGDTESDLIKENAVRELTQTCSMLQAQVQQLQGSMRDILKLVADRGINLSENGGGVATQTEISAVHTPQGNSASNWPYQKAASRPSSLSLTVQNNNFKKSLSNGKKESVQTKDADVGTLENLPGQTENNGSHVNITKTQDKAEMNSVDDKENSVLLKEST